MSIDTNVFNYRHVSGASFVEVTNETDTHVEGRMVRSGHSHTAHPFNMEKALFEANYQLVESEG